MVLRALASVKIPSASGAQGGGASFLPPPQLTPCSVDIRRAWSGAAVLIWRAGGDPESLGLTHSTLTYVFVHELALVPVVQVDELSSTLLLPVHPATDVLTASVCIEVRALPMPGEDKTRALGHCPAQSTDPKSEGDLSQLRGSLFPRSVST